MNLTEKDAAMKNQQAAVEDMTVIAEALVIEASTVENTTPITKGEIGNNTGEEMNTLIEEHIHLNTGAEVTMMTMNRGQGHQPIQETTLTLRTTQTAGGQIETRPDDRVMTDKGITHQMTMKDTKQEKKVVKARIAIERHPMRKPYQETGEMNT